MGPGYFCEIHLLNWNISEMFHLMNVTKGRMKVKITHSNTNGFSDHNQNKFTGLYNLIHI